MRPINFEGANTVFTAGGCDDLPVRVVSEPDDLVMCTSCWELDDEDLAAIVKSRRVLLKIVGRQPPVLLEVLDAAD